MDKEPAAVRTASPKSKNADIEMILDLQTLLIVVAFYWITPFVSSANSGRHSLFFPIRPFAHADENNGLTTDEQTLRAFIDLHGRCAVRGAFGTIADDAAEPSRQDR